MPQCKQCKAAPDGCCNHHKADAARGCTASQLTMRQNGIIVLTNDDPFKDEENLLLLQVPAVYAGRVRATVAALGSKIHYECAAEKGNQISLLVPTSLEAQLLRDLPLCRALSSTPFVVNAWCPHTTLPSICAAFLAAVAASPTPVKLSGPESVKQSLLLALQNTPQQDKIDPRGQSTFYVGGVFAHGAFFYHTAVTPNNESATPDGRRRHWHDVINGQKQATCRAYHKLKEVVTTAQNLDTSTCVDIGASPGGWTECLSDMPGSRVVAVDPGDVVPEISDRTNVEHLRLFLASPESYNKVKQALQQKALSCAVSDVNLPPAAAANLIVELARESMLADGATAIVTLKLTAKNNVERALQIDGARRVMERGGFTEITVVHLYANTEHERTLTAVWREREANMWVGTYTSNKGHIKGDKLGKGVSSFEFKGGVGASKASFNVVDPSYLCLSSDGKVVYGANEEAAGGVSSMSEWRVERRESGGADACHVALARGGSVLLATNYSSGSVSSFTVGEGGVLGERVALIKFEGGGEEGCVQDRQEGSHAHQVVAEGGFAWVCDLGSDKIWQLQVGEGGELEMCGGLEMARGSGPRHLALHPYLNFAYCLNELACSVSVLKVDRIGGGLTRLGEDVGLEGGGGLAAAIEVSPDGRFVICSLRGKNELVILKVDERKGGVEVVERVQVGDCPRDFSFTPLGDYLSVACQDSHEVLVFKVDRRAGSVERVEGERGRVEVGSPVCVKFG